MLPESALSYRLQGAHVVPDFLGTADHPWLRVLIEEHERYVGRRQRELDARLKEPLPCWSPPAKRRLAVQVLKREWRTKQESAVPPKQARALLFSASAAGESPPDARATVARRLDISEASLLASLFADLPGERVVAPPAQSMSSGELALRCNLALAQGLVFRSSEVHIALRGNARAVVRLARLRGLICCVTEASSVHNARLELSGPLSLFRNTLLYGRALGSLVGKLAWCQQYELSATCLLRGRAFELRIASGDPIFPASPAKQFDSKLEQRFARDFGRLAVEWDLVREPEPIRARDTMIFPDFALTHRRDPSRKWLLEIAGFWTPEYLARKFALVAAAKVDNLILCVDRDRNCAAGELPAGARVVGYRRFIDAAAVLALMTEAS